MGPVVDRQLSSLAEGLVAPRVLAPVGPMTGVHVKVVLQVLSERELLVTELALEPARGVVDCQVPFQAVLVRILLIAVRVSAGKLLTLSI